ESNSISEYGEACCEARATAAKQRFGRQCGANPGPLAALPRLVPDDSDSYSSTLLRELAKGRLVHEDAEDLCLADAALHRGEAGPAARLRCQQLLEGYLDALQGFRETELFTSSVTLHSFSSHLSPLVRMPISGPARIFILV
ncbi:unnamed protein product, partial [Polarella glacialis]